MAIFQLYFTSTKLLLQSFMTIGTGITATSFICMRFILVIQNHPIRTIYIYNWIQCSDWLFWVRVQK